MGGYDSSVVSTRGDSAVSKGKKVVREIELPGIGRATQLANGDINVHYLNGSRLIVNSTSAKVSYVSHSGQYAQYEQKDVIPPEVKSKLGQMPHIVKALMDAV